MARPEQSWQVTAAALSQARSRGLWHPKSSPGLLRVRGHDCRPETGLELFSVLTRASASRVTSLEESGGAGSESVGKGAGQSEGQYRSRSTVSLSSCGNACSQGPKVSPRPREVQQHEGGACSLTVNMAPAGLADAALLARPEEVQVHVSALGSWTDKAPM